MHCRHSVPLNIDRINCQQTTRTIILETDSHHHRIWHTLTKPFPGTLLLWFREIWFWKVELNNRGNVVNHFQFDFRTISAFFQLFVFPFSFTFDWLLLVQLDMIWYECIHKRYSFVHFLIDLLMFKMLISDYIQSNNSLWSLFLTKKLLVKCSWNQACLDRNKRTDRQIQKPCKSNGVHRRLAFWLSWQQHNDTCLLFDSLADTPNTKLNPFWATIRPVLLTTATFLVQNVCQFIWFPSLCLSSTDSWILHSPPWRH